MFIETSAKAGFNVKALFRKLALALYAFLFSWSAGFILLVRLRCFIGWWLLSFLASLVSSLALSCCRALVLYSVSYHCHKHACHLVFYVPSRPGMETAGAGGAGSASGPGSSAPAGLSSRLSLLCCHILLSSFASAYRACVFRCVCSLFPSGFLSCKFCFSAPAPVCHGSRCSTPVHFPVSVGCLFAVLPPASV